MATEVIKTIKSTGGDYNSLQAFLSGEARDLVALDEIAVAEVYDDFDSVAMDTSSQPWATDDTRKIIIRNAPGLFHSGNTNEGIKLIVESSSYFLTLEPGHDMLIEGFELTGNSTASKFLYETDASLKIKKCIIHDINGSFSNSSGLKLLQNCSVWQVDEYVAYGSDATKVVNCSIYADGVGALDNQIILRDCICYNTVIYNTTTGGYSNFYSCTGNYNASNDTSAPGANSIDNITLSEISWSNVTAGSEDLSIGENSILIDAGIGNTQNNDVPLQDIANNDRGLTVCAIGAYEYVGSTVNEIALNSSWKIRNENKQDTSSKILADNNISTAWKILNTSNNNISWKTKAELSENISWKMQNEIIQGISWKILNEENKDTAWKILRAGILEQDISWKILNEVISDTSYKILNETQQDIAWQILGRNETAIDISWKILNQTQNALQWKIQNEATADISWKILNEFGVDTSWKILEVKSADLAYKIFNELEQDISWKIVSGIILKSVELMSSKKELEINTVKRTFAFNQQTKTLIFHQNERK